MRIVRGLLACLLCYLAVGCGVLSVRHNVAASEAMAPTINPGDHFASVGIKDNELDPIERFNIVVFKPPPNEKLRVTENDRFVFRVIALSGEKFEIRKGVVFINDAPLDESSFEKRPSTDDFKPVNVTQNQYFLLGDNRPNSADSRFIGTIRRGDIDGTVETIIRKEDYDNGKRW